MIPPSRGTIIGNMTGGGGLAAAFDGITNQSDANSAKLGAAGGDAAVGKRWGQPILISRLLVYATNDADFYAGGSGQILVEGSQDGFTTAVRLYTGANRTYTNSEIVEINRAAGLIIDTAYEGIRVVFPSNGANDRRCACVQLFPGS